LDANTQIVAEAYRHLFTIQDVAAGKRDAQSDPIRESLVFLSWAGRSSVREGSIDCEYFFQYALDILGNAATYFAEHYGQIWSAYGMMLGELLTTIEGTTGGGHQIQIDKSVRIGWFSEEFARQSWRFRADIIAGFTVLARKNPRRTEVFWRVVDEIEKAFVAALGAEGQMRVEVAHALTTYTKFWASLCGDFGRKQDVREHFAGSAVKLLELIDKFEAVGLEALKSWKLALRSLGLSVVTATGDWSPGPDRRGLQKSLDETAAKIDALWKSTPRAMIRNWLEEERADLIPYLHGRTARGARIRKPPIPATAEFYWSGKQIDEPIPITIADICTETGRGFHIEAKYPIPTKSYDGSRHKPCLEVGITVPTLSPLDPQYTDEVILNVSYTSHDSAERHYRIACQILRAWHTSDQDVSGWVLHAMEHNLNDEWQDWRNFIETLSPAS
jgi:hypothetical protein